MTGVSECDFPAWIDGVFAGVGERLGAEMPHRGGRCANGLFASAAAYGASGHKGDVQFEITRVDRPIRPHRTLFFEWRAYADPGVVADAIVATYHELARG